MMIFALYQPDSAVIREKIAVRTLDRSLPLMTALIADGEDVGHFVLADSPARVAEQILLMRQGFQDVQFRDLLRGVAGEPGMMDVLLGRVESIMGAMERLLGLESGRLYRPETAELIEMYRAIGVSEDV